MNCKQLHKRRLTNAYLQFGFLLLVLDVGLLVEVGEQEIEHEGVHADPPDESSRVVALGEQQLEGVGHHEHELDHLEGGQVLFPPQEPLVSGAEGGDQVIGVHDDVDEGVEEAEEGGVAAWGEFHAEPHGHRHHSVVDNVQGGELVVLFPHHEEYLDE